MKAYTINIYRITRKGRELHTVMKFRRPRFTNREYKEILVPALIDLAGTSIDFKWLTAEIECDGENVLTALCDTTVDGSTIRASIAAARPRERFRRLRTITIAS